ncbi:hypothetical protein A9K55_003606 [Cordyceps militaris]|uniref:Uncharacterized protein n=1 Tax=Cordyceps militaris TaxID=73501 RepID=A0A2H4S7R0_CORMI|nr:hypothetical protein A9K55_003606 [Cordyceps militaris]
MSIAPENDVIETTIAFLPVQKPMKTAVTREPQTTAPCNFSSSWLRVGGFEGSCSRTPPVRNAVMGANCFPGRLPACMGFPT